jgi:hypothetical protein
MHRDSRRFDVIIRLKTSQGHDLSALQEYEYGMDDGDEPRRHGREDPKTGSDSDTGAGKGPEPETDFRALAEDWISIWQSEITAYLTDPETQQAWAAMMTIWAQAAQTMMRAMPPNSGFGQGFAAGFGANGERASPRAKPPAAHERRPKRDPAKPSGSDAAPRAAPVAAAPVARDDEVRRLEQRVAELERHMAARNRADQDRRRGAPGENRRTRRPGRPRS